MHIGRFLALEGTIQKDNLRHFRYYIGFSLRVPFGEEARAIPSFNRRMTEAPVRDVDVVTVRRFKKDLTSKNAQVVKEIAPAAAPATAAPAPPAPPVVAGLPGGAQQQQQQLQQQAKAKAEREAKQKAEAERKAAEEEIARKAASAEGAAAATTPPSTPPQGLSSITSITPGGEDEIAELEKAIEEARGKITTTAKNVQNLKTQNKGKSPIKRAKQKAAKAKQNLTALEEELAQKREAYTEDRATEKRDGASPSKRSFAAALTRDVRAQSQGEAAGSSERPAPAIHEVKPHQGKRAAATAAEAKAAARKEEAARLEAERKAKAARQRTEAQRQAREEAAQLAEAARRERERRAAQERERLEAIEREETARQRAAEEEAGRQQAASGEASGTDRVESEGISDGETPPGYTSPHLPIGTSAATPQPRISTQTSTNETPPPPYSGPLPEGHTPFPLFQGFPTPRQQGQTSAPQDVFAGVPETGSLLPQQQQTAPRDPVAGVPTVGSLATQTAPAQRNPFDGVPERPIRTGQTAAPQDPFEDVPTVGSLLTQTAPAQRNPFDDVPERPIRTEQPGAAAQAAVHPTPADSEGAKGQSTFLGMEMPEKSLTTKPASSRKKKGALRERQQRK
eukprot:g8354.t1